jgi:hypothetical protein
VSAGFADLARRALPATPRPGASFVPRRTPSAEFPLSVAAPPIDRFD